MDPRLHLPFMHPGEKGARLIPAGSIEASPAKHDARPGSRGHRAGAVERSSDEKGEAGDDVRSCFPVTAAGPLPSGQSLNGSTVLADVALLLSHRNHEPSGSGCVNGSVNETGQNRLRQTRRARPLATTEHLSAHLSEHGEDRRDTGDSCLMPHNPATTSRRSLVGNGHSSPHGSLTDWLSGSGFGGTGGIADGP
jgi:hypothetical protein